MSQSPKDTLTSLIQDLKTYLQQETLSSVLTSPEEAAYFRKTFSKPSPLPPKEIAPPILPPPLPPIQIVSSPQKTLPEPLPERKEKIVEKKEEPKSTASFSPPQSTPHSIPSVSFEDVRHLLARIAPQLPILSEIPSDEIAKKIASRWKTKNQTAPISLLYFQEPPAQKALLEQIVKALDIYYGPAKLVSAESIEKEKQWEAFLSAADLKRIIVCDYTLWQLTELMRFYKENPTQGTRLLGTVPLFLLPDLSLYLKDPLLKRSLWKALSHTPVP